MGEYDTRGKLQIITHEGKTYSFEEVKHFIYLGTELYRNADINKYRDD